MPEVTGVRGTTRRTVAGAARRATEEDDGTTLVALAPTAGPHRRKR